jgi:hypothetical protein
LGPPRQELSARMHGCAQEGAEKALVGKNKIQNLLTTAGVVRDTPLTGTQGAASSGAIAEGRGAAFLRAESSAAYRT